MIPQNQIRGQLINSLTKMVPRETPKNTEDQGKDNADQQAGDYRKIEGKIAAPHQDIPGQTGYSPQSPDHHDDYAQSSQC